MNVQPSPAGSRAERASIIELQHLADSARDWPALDLCTRALRGHPDAATTIADAIEARRSVRPVEAHRHPNRQGTPGTHNRTNR